MSESELVAALKAGDQHAYKLLVDMYQVPLLRVCKGLVHEEADARDLVQDTFLEVFQSIRDFRQESRLSTWLYRIAVNKSLNHLRKKKFMRWIKPGFASDSLTSRETIDTPDDHPLPDTHIELRERARHIRKAVDKLPENQRIAFILFRYQDLSYKEISEIMGVSLSSIESLLHRAKMGLYRNLIHLFKNNTL